MSLSKQIKWGSERGIILKVPFKYITIQCFIQYFNDTYYDTVWEAIFKVLFHLITECQGYVLQTQYKGFNMDVRDEITISQCFFPLNILG